MAQEICIYDRVTLHNGLQGTVEFMGGRPLRLNGIFYGITLDEYKGAHDGTFNKIEYFECEDERGIFVPRNEIMQSQATKFNQALPRVCIGDKVYLKYKQQTGTLRYVGIAQFAPGSGCWYGVELDEPIGENNGYIDGRWYFHCSLYHGIMCQAKHIQPIKNGMLPLQEKKEDKIEMVESMDFMQLKIKCILEGLSISGSKEQLLSRLRGHLQHKNGEMEGMDFVRDMTNDTEYAVSGYGRKYSEREVPDDILMIIVLLFGCNSWSEVFKGNDIRIDQNMIRMTANARQSICCTYSVKSGIHRWRFKILGINKKESLMIGIIGMGELKLKKYFENNNTSLSNLNDVAVYDVTNGMFLDRIGDKWMEETYGRRCEENDEVEMCLNLQQQILSFSINGEDQGILTNKWSGEGRIFRMAVSLSGINVGVELL